MSILKNYITWRKAIDTKFKKLESGEQRVRMDHSVECAKEYNKVLKKYEASPFSSDYDSEICVLSLLDSTDRINVHIITNFRHELECAPCGEELGVNVTDDNIDDAIKNHKC